MPFEFDLDNPLADPEPEAHAPDSQEFEEQFSEAERRFARAQYYRALLSEPLFADDDSQNAQEVVEEIRGFIRGRLAALLGVKSEAPKAESQFSPEELQVLKAVCSKVLKKPALIQAAPPAPAVKKVEGPKKPQVRPTRSPEAPKPEAKKQKARPQESQPEIPVETITVDQKTYSKKMTPEGEEYWQDRGGNRYVIGTNDAGQYYFKSINVQARPVGIKPAPAPNAQMKMLIAAKHAEASANQLDYRLEKRQNNSGDNAPAEAL